MYSGRCDPSSCVLRRVAVELLIYMLCFVPTGLICKTCSQGLVHFTGETLSVSFQKFCSSDDPDLTRLGASQVVSEQRFCDLSYAFHIDV